MLRSSVVDATIIAGPTLNAIHAGENASSTERALKPLLDRRDTLEMASTNMSAQLRSVTEDISETEAKTLGISETNRGLASELLALVSKINEQTNAAKAEPQLKAGISDAKDEADTARTQWRIMKSVVAVIVAGSGVSWAKNSELRDLVLDAEDECD